MNYKKTMLVISLILCILFSVSCAFAGDLNDEVITSDNQETSTATVVEEMDNIDDGTLQENDDLNVAGDNDVLSANPKTFSNLNTTINGNDDSEVYLDGNYTYELGTDDAFKDGVVINRAVTVYGNGFTLDGMD